MQAGKLRNQVVLQEKSVTRDAYGGETVTWTDVTTVYAEVNPWNMRERLSLLRQQGESAIIFRVRAPLDVSLGKRFYFDSVGYEVTDVDRSFEHRGELLITCTAEDNAL